MNRRQQRQARLERKQARLARRAKREERLKLEGPKPEIVKWPEPTDQLECYDRTGQPIGHVLRNLWRPNPAFLVCGGPSLRKLDLSVLRERGIMSLGVNNVAAFAPVRAFVCSDPPDKFHHAVWLDPAIMKLIPKPKLTKRVRAKVDGEFRYTAFRTQDCPNVWGFNRCTTFDPATFLTAQAASWGVSKADSEKTGRPTVYFTMLLGVRLLHYLGVRRVYMIGVDFTMGTDPGQGYAFSQNRWTGAVAGNLNSYLVVTKMFVELKPYFDQAGFEVYQCNPESALKVFPFVPFEQAVEDCRGLVGKEPFDTEGFYNKPGEQQHQEEADDRGTD